MPPKRRKTASALARPASRVSIATLPFELLVKILSPLRPAPLEHASPDRRARVQGLLSAMQSCIALHRAGREVLYKEFDTWQPPPSYLAKTPEDAPRSVLRAFSRAIAIRENAVVVRDLSGLGVAASQFPLDSDKVTSVPNSEVKACRALGYIVPPNEGLALQRSILLACTNVRSVGVLLHDVEHARRLGELIANLPHLVKLSLDVLDERGRKRPSNLDLHVACLEAIASSWRNGPNPDRKLEELAFNEGVCETDSPTDAPERKGTYRRYLASAFETPQATAPGHALTSLEVYYDKAEQLFVEASRAPQTWALPVLEGNQLEIVKLSKTWYEFAGPEFSIYKDITRPDRPDEDGDDQRRGYTLEFDDAVFKLFPCARRLELSSMKRMTLDKLAILAESSPHLERLKLSACHWLLDRKDLGDEGDSDSESTDALDPPKEQPLSQFEEDLVRALQRFKRLKYTNIGILPFLQYDEGELSETRPALWRRAAECGIELECIGCQLDDY